MKKLVSNSMSRENDPHFDIITPVCKACRNFQEGFRCKVYGDRPKEYGYNRHNSFYISSSHTSSQ